MILESKHSLFLLPNPKRTIPGSVYQREGISSLEGRVRKTEHLLGIRPSVSVSGALPQTGLRQVIESRPLLSFLQKGVKDRMIVLVFQRVLRIGIWSIFRSKRRGAML